MSETESHLSGGCLCGAVRFKIGGALRPVLVCHCGMCQKSHGGPAYFAGAKTDDITLTEERGLKWYRSSEMARRGFCSECGSSLFWEPLGKDYWAVACGSLEAPTGVTAVGHIFVSDKGDYYEIAGDLPQFERGTNGQVPQRPSAV